MSSDRITIGRRSYLRGRKMSPAAIAFLAARDLLLEPFFKSKKVPLPQGSALRQICVCQMDYLGDLLILTPFVAELRKFAPQARITLVVGRWCGELAEVLKAGRLIDEHLIHTSWLLDSSPRSTPAKLHESWRTLFSTARLLRAKNLDAFFDLRPWSPNAWLLAHLSRAKLRVGYGLRGMSGVYNHLPAFSTETSTGQNHLNVLQAFTGKNFVFAAPVLPAVPLPAHLDLPASGYWAVQLFSREEARNIPIGLWEDILRRLARRLPVVLVGAPVDAGRAQSLVKLPGVISLIGRTNIRDLLGVIQQSRGVVSIDSFAPHVGLAYAKRVAVLMVAKTSNRFSFPQNNPGLKFFQAAASGDAIENFLAPTASPAQQALPQGLQTT